MQPNPRSLDHVAAGDTVTVERILFDGVRGRCREHGVAEGARLSCRTADAEQIVVETETGRAVPCERSLARFIEVRRTARGDVA